MRRRAAITQFGARSTRASVMSVASWISGGIMADRRVLELRIHGVNNTSPASMLELEPDFIEKTKGDALGSFWRPTDEGRSRSPIDERVEREAYSWGGMARSSVGGGAGFGAVVRGVARVGWALLLPFGLVNVAYWTRKFDDGPPPRAAEPRETPPPTKGPPPEAASRRPGWTEGRGAASLRVAGLLITLLMTVTASVVALDLIAVQCYVGGTKVCTALPSLLDFLTGFGQARRLALLSLVPVLLVAALLGLSALTRVRYEQPNPDKPDVEASTAKLTWPVLSVDGFWSHRDITKVTARLHVAATAALVSIATACHVALGYGESCDTPAEFVSTECRPRIPNYWWEMGVIGAGALIFLLVVASVVMRSDYAVDVPAPISDEKQTDETEPPAPKKQKPGHAWTDWVPLALAIALFVVQAVVLATMPTGQQPTTRHLVGSSMTPAILLTVLLALGLSALLWRLSVGTRWWHAPAVLGTLLTLLAGVVAWTHSWVAAAAIVAIILVILAIKGKCLQQKNGRDEPAPRSEAWGGSAPGVFLLLAVLMAMLLSSTVATAAGNWLNGANSAASLADREVPVQVETEGCAFSCSTVLRPPNLEVPLPYMWFGAMCLPIVLLFGVAGGIGLWKSLRWRGIQPADGTRTDRPTTSLGTAAGQGLEEPSASALKTRRIVAFAQRAEVLVTWLAVSGTAGMVVAMGFSAFGVKPSMSAPGYAQAPLNIGMWVLAAGGLLVIGLAVGGTIIGGSRPLGLAWDLMCFLPRAGHPLAPPCYAERVVPELSERCRVWLRDHAGHSPAIVLSAHSLGSVLAVGVILSPRITDSKDALSLLSYGSQLRAYFSRIFPELLGPKVLGTRPCGSSSLTTGDPWQKEIETHGGSDTELPTSEKDSMRDVLSAAGSTDTRWRNLWRRTDYLGFPVWGYPGNPVDRQAEEVVSVDYLAEIQTHGGYPRTVAYDDAFEALTGIRNGDRPSPQQP
jgi:hypothetical protein